MPECCSKLPIIMQRSLLNLSVNWGVGIKLTGVIRLIQVLASAHESLVRENPVFFFFPFLAVPVDGINLQDRTEPG